MPRKKSNPDKEVSKTPNNNVQGPPSVPLKQSRQNQSKSKRSYNFQKLKNEVNRKNKKFISSSTEPKRAIRTDKTILGSKFQKHKKAVEQNLESWKSVVGVLKNVKSKCDKAEMINGEELRFALDKIIELTEDTNKVLETMDLYSKNCIEQVEQLNRDFESIKSEHISFIQGLIKFIDTDWREERQFDD
jgi:transcriptional regulator with GAF, ATPase, and Fis domain